MGVNGSLSLVLWLVPSVVLLLFALSFTFSSATFSITAASSSVTSSILHLSSSSFPDSTFWVVMMLIARVYASIAGRYSALRNDLFPSSFAFWASTSILLVLDVMVLCRSW